MKSAVPLKQDWILCVMTLMPLFIIFNFGSILTEIWVWNILSFKMNISGVWEDVAGDDLPGPFAVQCFFYLHFYWSLVRWQFLQLSQEEWKSRVFLAEGGSCHPLLLKNIPLFFHLLVINIIQWFWFFFFFFTKLFQMKHV